MFESKFHDINSYLNRRQDTTEKKVGITRDHFNKLFGFDKEEENVLNNIRSVDQLNTSSPFDDIEEIRCLKTNLNCIETQLEELRNDDRSKGFNPRTNLELLGLMDPQRDQIVNELKHSLGQKQVELFKIARSLKAFDTDESYDRTKQNLLTGKISKDALDTLKYVNSKYVFNSYHGIKNHRDKVDIGKEVRSRYKEILRNCSEYYKFLKDQEAYLKTQVSFRDAPIKLWNGSLSKDKIKDLVQLMENDEVMSCEDLVKGSTKVKKVTLKSGIVGIFKGANSESGHNEQYKNEIAAYKLDELLGLDMVPITVSREINNEQGSLQWWVEGLRQFPNVLQTANARFFDLLINNSDRPCQKSGYLICHNFGYLADDPSQTVLFDNALSFDQKVPQVCDEVPDYKPNSSILERARQLNMRMLESIDLDKQQKENLLARRDKLIEAIDQEAQSTTDKRSTVDVKTRSSKQKPLKQIEKEFLEAKQFLTENIHRLPVETLSSSKSKEALENIKMDPHRETIKSSKDNIGNNIDTSSSHKNDHLIIKDKFMGKYKVERSGDTIKYNTVSMDDSYKIPKEKKEHIKEKEKMITVYNRLIRYGQKWIFDTRYGKHEIRAQSEKNFRAVTTYLTQVKELLYRHIEKEEDLRKEQWLREKARIEASPEYGNKSV